MSTDPYLSSCEAIDWQHPFVLQQAEQLKQQSVLETAKQCFEFVRDEIMHSSDFQLNPVTWAASQVLRHKTGYCYAKAHLLAALLRANGIPTGLVYQRLCLNDDNQDPYCIHGLVAANLPEYGWYRMDPRGNKKGVNAQFCPPKEQLAFAGKLKGEGLYEGVHAQPFPEVIGVLTAFRKWDDVLRNLPDRPL